MLLAANCFALELVRQKNVATVIVFPLIDSTTTTALQSSATALDSEIDQWSDSGNDPNGFADCRNEAVEIGTDGQYYLVLTQAEMNDDYIMVQIKASDALTQVILIRTIVGDPLNLATTTAGAVAATETALTTASGYASDAKTAAEKIDTNTELRTLLYGSDTAGATATALSTASGYASDAKTAAEKLDTSTKLRTLLTGADTAVSTLTASDNIGINWDDISNPTSAVGLTNTTVGIVTTNSDLVSAASIADAVWNETSTGHTEAGYAGQQLWSDIDAVLADTGELQTNQGAWATATSVGLSDNAITAAKITDDAWQELIELLFSFDATGAYGDEGGSVVDQIADNAASGGGDATGANQTTILARLAAIMSKDAADPVIGTYDVATDSLEAQQENPQAPPIID